MKSPRCIFIVDRCETPSGEKVITRCGVQTQRGPGATHCWDHRWRETETADKHPGRVAREEQSFSLVDMVRMTRLRKGSR